MTSAADPSASALSGRRLLVVLGSYRSKKHIYERARDLGVRLVVVDGPDHWVRDAPEIFERHLPVALDPFDTFAARAIAAIRDAGLAFDGIGTIDEFAGSFAAAIATGLKLPFHSQRAVDVARDKHRVREVCAASGLAGPRFARIEGLADVEAALAAVPLPAVLKPVRGVGSVQACRVTDATGLERHAGGILASASASRALTGGRRGSDRDWFDLMWSGPAALILESWLEGPKFDVDLVLHGGEAVYGRVTDDLQPFGLRDVQRIAPSDLAAGDEGALVDHAARCVRAIGFMDGVFNVEVKLTEDGPITVEVNGRLGGYSTVDIHREVWGVDLVEQWLRLCLGLFPRIEPREPQSFVAESLLPAPASGRLQRDGFLDALAGDPSLLACRQWVFAGEGVEGQETGAPDWLGAVLARAPSRREALNELERLVAKVRPVIE